MEPESVDLEHCAIVVVDIQNDFFHENGSMAKANNDISSLQKIVPNVQKFLAEARQLEIPIMHVRTEHSKWTDSSSWRQRSLSGGNIARHCRPGSWGAEFYQVTPEPGECIIIKHRYSAFISTDLDLVLTSLGAKTIALVGATTNVCVECTARDGYMRDYYVVLLEDCVAAFTASEHEASLFNIRKYFGVVTGSPRLVEAWKIRKKLP